VQVFDEEGALDRFEAFASLNGARFYGLPPNPGTITLVRRPASLPAAVAVDDDEVVVFRGGTNLPWSIEQVRP
jgi:dihydroorotase